LAASRSALLVPCGAALPGHAVRSTPLLLMIDNKH
jgi:hypothetical protein